jgi:hypothetical protein
MRARAIVAALVLSATAAVMSPAMAQRPDTSGPQKEAMQKIAHWIGEWEGTGWSMRGPGQKEEFSVTESVQPKLGGMLLLVQGLGKGKDPSTGAETVGHDALAVVSFDPKESKYRFRHYTMDGASGDDEIVLTEKGMNWELKTEGQPVRIRFTIEIQGDTWHEFGEFSRDGTTWARMMEMTLQRVSKKG